MGNKVITGACMCDDNGALDFQDIVDADFDFISVAVRDASSCTTSSSRAFVPAAKMVAVVPVDPSPLSFDKVSMKTTVTSSLPSNVPTSPTTEEQPPLSFNDRLHMLKWDLEDIAVPSCGERPLVQNIQEPVKSIFNTSRPHKPSESVQLKRKTPFAWLSRAVDSYRSSATKKKTQQAALNKNTKMQDGEEDVETKTVKMSKTQVSLAANDTVFCDEEPVSDTESESNDSVSAVSELSCCVKNEVDTSFASTSVFTAAYSLLRNDSSSVDSIASCDSLSDDDDEISMDYFAAANIACIEMSGYLCHCGGCPVYKDIETEVTNSTCWMNERERQSICRILQAYSTYNDAAGFIKPMIASAEECLLVFHGDENAAFNAFVMIGKRKWE